MFWNKKKNLNNGSEIPEETEEEKEETNLGPDAEDLEEFGYGDEEADEAEELEEEEISDDEEYPEEENGSDTSKLPPITLRCESIDMLAEFANNRANGALQFMKKETCEIFEIKEVHLRIAEVWGSVSMAREYSDEEYAKIMLAIELKNDSESFYVLPGLTENEIKQAIEDFSEERFEENGKKYSHNTGKFTKLLKQNDCMEEWKAYTKSILYDKLTEFCDENCIEFESIKAENESAKEGDPDE